MKTIDDYCVRLDRRIITNPLDVIMRRDLGDRDMSNVREAIGKGSHAITVTFMDSQLLKYSTTWLCNEVDKVFKKTRAVDRYILVSDVSAAGRFHLHGSIYISNIKAITTLRRKLVIYGISKIKLLDNAVKWADYCTLQYLPDGKKGVRLESKDMKLIRG